MSCELTSSISVKRTRSEIIQRERDSLVAEVGEPPDVAQTNRDRDAGEQEVKFAAERSSLSILVLRDRNFKTKIFPTFDFDYKSN